MRLNSDPAKIQSIRVPAGLHGDVSFGESVAVTRARFYQQVHFSAVRLEESSVQL